MDRVSVIIVGESHQERDQEAAKRLKEQMDQEFSGQVEVAFMNYQDAINSMKPAPPINPNSSLPIVVVDDRIISQGTEVQPGRIAQEIRDRLNT